MKEFEVNGIMAFEINITVEASNEDSAIAKAEAYLETPEGIKEIVENGIPDVQIDYAECYD